MKLISSKEDVKIMEEQFTIGWKIILDIIFVIQLWLPRWNLVVPDNQIPSSYATPGFKPFSTCFPFISSVRWIDRTRWCIGLLSFAGFKHREICDFFCLIYFVIGLS